VENIFPDTSFLYPLYRQDIHSPHAIHWLNSSSSKLHVSSLLALEFRQSIRFHMRLSEKNGSHHLTETAGTQVLDDFAADLLAGIYQTATVDWPAVHLRAEDLSKRYTRAAGHRLVDILHVATALHLNASTFLTFDANQRTLAETEGLTVPFPA
jgi:predicted nucleic acid-binding protein